MSFAFKEGFLGKKPTEGFMKGWKFRWFSLRQDGLWYYAEPSDREKGEPLGKVEIKGLQVEKVAEPIDSKHQICFKGVPAKMKGMDLKSYYFSCESEEERDLWMRAIEAAQDPGAAPSESVKAMSVSGTLNLEVGGCRKFSSSSDVLDITVVTRLGTQQLSSKLFPNKGPSHVHGSYLFDVKAIPSTLFLVFFNVQARVLEEHMGTVQINLQDLPNKETVELWCKVRGRTKSDVKYSGEIHLSLTISVEEKKEVSGSHFGIPLAELMMRPDHSSLATPLIVSRCIKFLSNVEPTETLFCPTKDELAALFETRASLSEGDDIQFGPDTSPRLVAGLLLTFLRDLPEPLFGYQNHKAVMEAKSGSPLNKSVKIQAILEKVPPFSQILLSRLCHLLHKYTIALPTPGFSSVVSTVFAPIISRPRSLDGADLSREHWVLTTFVLSLVQVTPLVLPDPDTMHRPSGTALSAGESAASKAAAKDLEQCIKKKVIAKLAEKEQQ